MATSYRPTEVKRFCAYCGTDLKPAGRFCAACGASVEAVQTAPSASPATTNRANRIKFVIAVIGAVLVAGGGSGWLFWHTTHSQPSVVSSVIDKPPIVENRPAVANKPPTPVPATIDPIVAAPAPVETPPAVIPSAALKEPSHRHAVPEPLGVPALPPIQAEQPQAAAEAPVRQVPEPAAVPALLPVTDPPPAAVPADNRRALSPSIQPASNSYSGPLAGDLAYTGPPVMQNGEITFDGLPSGQLRLVYDEKAWDAHFQQTTPNTQRLVLRNKRPGNQKKCTVKWNVIQ